MPAVETVYPVAWTAGRPVPFPTLYWLTDATLCRAVADLERRGGVRRFEAELADDPAMRLALADDHDRYRRERWAALTPDDRAALRWAGREAALTRTGIAGIHLAGGAGVPRGIGLKCLHAHVAHELASGNTIGRRVLAVVGG